MSVRLHVAKKYDVKYSSNSRFNYQQDDVYRLLNNLGMNVMGEIDDEEFNVDKENYKECLPHLLEDDFENKEEVEGIVKRLFPNAKSDNETLRKITFDYFKEFLDESDPQSDEIHFCWF